MFAHWFELYVHCAESECCCGGYRGVAGGLLFRKLLHDCMMVGMFVVRIGGAYPDSTITAIARTLINGGYRISSPCSEGNPSLGVEDQLWNFRAGPCGVKRTILEA